MATTVVIAAQYPAGYSVAGSRYREFVSSFAVLCTHRCKTLQDLTDTETDTSAGNPAPLNAIPSNGSHLEIPTLHLSGDALRTSTYA